MVQKYFSARNIFFSARNIFLRKKYIFLRKKYIFSARNKFFSARNKFFSARNIFFSARNIFFRKKYFFPQEIFFFPQEIFLLKALYHMLSRSVSLSGARLVLGWSLEDAAMDFFDHLRSLGFSEEEIGKMRDDFIFSAIHKKTRDKVDMPNVRWP